MAAERAFTIHSNVGRYWLANGQGFDVVVERGRRLGVVENVVVNPVTQEASTVVVKRRLSARLRRPARLPVDELTAVVPASRRFLVTARGPARTPRDRTAALRRLLGAARDRVRADWPAVRQALVSTAARIGDALVACVAVSAALAEAGWRAGSARLRESGLDARSRSRRMR